ncbi:uncharacterized protein si:dkey-29h14.10 isoform X2 [Chiloscyllium plagiosum]|uniref:uncharacterized protein si:dkey-29h14.10 isoform X2 n=1 Tax=Chiloscyllium plagiosum TaxID=36176 RepID=UPI001CB84F77|nr:uncharacterized protein si:dkey-29h14.10 isoform X2 [Chiloscyllium plagiosum]
MASQDLRRHYYTLSTSMGPALVEQVICFLYSSQVLSQYELNVITSKSDILTKACELLSAVIRKGKKACGIFFQALAMCDPHLSNQIFGTQARPHTSEPTRPGEALSSQRQCKSLPVICKICICNSSLSNCTFGSNNNISIMRSTSLSALENFADPASSVNAECGKALEMMSKSHTCGSSNEMSTSNREAIQVESDIEIIRSKLQNMIIGNQNTFTLVEQISDKEENEDKELDEEYEENECEEKEYSEQLTNETRQPEAVQQFECCRLMAG